MISSIPAVLIGVFVRSPYLHAALLVWAGLITAFTASMAQQQYLSPGTVTLAAWFLSPIVVGYIAALIAWLVRRN